MNCHEITIIKETLDEISCSNCGHEVQDNDVIMSVVNQYHEGSKFGGVALSHDGNFMPAGGRTKPQIKPSQTTLPFCSIKCKKDYEAFEYQKYEEYREKEKHLTIVVLIIVVIVLFAFGIWYLYTLMP